jgi:hypothetical protein
MPVACRLMPVACRLLPEFSSFMFFLKKILLLDPYKL